jgi:hypothetical protein
MLKRVQADREAGEGGAVMKIGYERAQRVVQAALAVLDVESRWSAEGSAPGAQAAKRELEAAVSDYLDHHATGAAPIPSTRRRGQ